jgi:hypothetical protein
VDDDTGKSIDMEGRYNYNKIEQIVEEAIKYEFE